MKFEKIKEVKKGCTLVYTCVEKKTGPNDLGVISLKGEFFKQTIEVSSLDFQNLCGLGLVAAGLFQKPGDVTFFKIVQGLLEWARFEKLVRSGS